MKAETIAQRKAGTKVQRELRVIGNIMKEERKRQKLSLSKLSELVYGNPYSAKSLSEYERGIREGVEFMTLVKIFKVLGLSVV